MWKMNLINFTLSSAEDQRNSLLLDIVRKTLWLILSGELGDLLGPFVYFILPKISVCVVWQNNNNFYKDLQTVNLETVTIFSAEF